MGEFGHITSILPGFGCIDSWGAGPFVIEAGGKRFRFEDSDRFGPTLINRRGDPLKNPWPSERSPFWRAHRIWVRQGRETAADGITCVWREPKQIVVARLDRRNVQIIENGEEDGAVIEIGESDA